MSGNAKRRREWDELELFEDDDSDIATLSKSPYFTQATQIVDRDLAKKPRVSSPPPEDIIEVPVSSPFQETKESPVTAKKAWAGIFSAKAAGASTRAPSLMAPRGTLFRPPARRLVQEQSTKTKSPVVEIPDSSDEDERSMRGDIKPSFFTESAAQVFEVASSLSPEKERKSHATSLSPTKPTKNSPTKQPPRRRLMRGRRRIDSSPAKSPSQKSALTLDSRTTSSKSQQPQQSTSRTQQTNMSREDPIMISSDDSDSDLSVPGSRSHSSTPATSATEPTRSSSELNSPPESSQDQKLTKAATKKNQSRDSASPPLYGSPYPTKPVRDRKAIPAARPSAKPAARPSAKPEAKPKAKPVITLSDNEDDGDDYEDAYQPPKPSRRVSAPSEEDASEQEETSVNGRVLKYLNECDAIQLMEVAAIKAESSAKAMLKHRPFRTLDAALRVTMMQKKGSKSAKVAIGEEIVTAIQDYTSKLDGINHIIQECEKWCGMIKTETSKWKLDFLGQPRGGKSLALRDLQFTTEPDLMKGHCTLKPYQLYGMNWMFLMWKKDFGGILADDMGLGKTCQVIAFICCLAQHFEKLGSAGRDDIPKRYLIVVPSSTFSNWQAEFEKFAPDLKVTTYYGSEYARDQTTEDILDDPTPHHVILTTYTQLARSKDRQDDINNMREIKPIVAIFDEGHELKNPNTARHRSLARITSTWRLLLTGTPIQNNIMEMLGLLRFIQPKLVRDHIEDLEALFSQKFSVKELSQGLGLESERIARARSILEPFILQRRKKQVLPNMPRKTYTKILCDMSPEQAAVYQEKRERFKKTKNSGGRANDNNNPWMQLRKAADHPLMFRRRFDDETCEEMARALWRSLSSKELGCDKPAHLVAELKAYSDFELHKWCRDYPGLLGKYDVPEAAFAESSKVQALLKLVAGFKESGDRVLIFTKFKEVMEIVQACLDAEDISCLCFSGNTEVLERQDLIDRFSSDPSVTAFILTTGAGGTGINLTAANKVVIFDPSDNPQEDIQAENRAHRIGQTRDVEVIRLISRGTVEEVVYNAGEIKKRLAMKVTGCDEDEVSSADVEMTKSEMQKLVWQHESGQGGVITPPDDD